jgi:hypothetical protein
MQQLWAQIDAIEEQHWLTEDEMARHARVTKVHKADHELSHVLEDIEIRIAAFPDRENWVHVTPHEILTRYSIRPTTKAYVDLSASLDHAGRHKVTVRGRRGYNLPALNAMLTPTQKAGLKLIEKPEKGV